MNAQQFRELLQRYRAGTCTQQEKELVESWYESRRREAYRPMPDEEEAVTGEKMYREIAAALQHEPVVKRMPVWRKYRWVAAAALIPIAIGVYLTFIQRPAPLATAEPGRPATGPIVPGGNKALLTLADGSVIVLDSAANDTLSMQGKTVVFKKQDGQLVYDAGAGGEQDATAFNTISTPRGGQYQVVLPDGSRVWLNAASSLRFPASFTGNERVVELTGEGYFEVAPFYTAMPGGAKKKMPFKVVVTPPPGSVGGAEVEVLGTHFNIMAYSDEATMKTTLLEGAVNIRTNDGLQMLKPGQQAQLARNGKMQLLENADTDEAVAWKNGRFYFNNADVQTVMRQVARWYDVEIEYAGNIPAEKFAGEIPRNSSIGEIVQMLKLSDVHCKIEGKRIIILP